MTPHPDRRASDVPQREMDPRDMDPRDMDPRDMDPRDMDTVYARACEAMPGGVSSPVRAFGAVGGTPVFLKSARGAIVTDITGREYVDLVCSWGPALLGHAHPEVVAAVTEAASHGLSFGAPTTAEVTLAEAIRTRVPIAEKVRFCSTGTEATMTAIRIARGATGRALIVKFAGCYHGHSDALLAEAGSGVATAGLPGSAGVTAGAAADTIVLPYNDYSRLRHLFDSHGDQIAAVITEAAPANMGVVPPIRTFNRYLRSLTARSGALLILDEVLTGFRVGPAGWWGLDQGVEPWDDQGQEPWDPDLICFGKVVGGGLPLAAVAGRADLMNQLAPLGPVYQAGTLSGNPLATAAGITTLRLADDRVYAHLNQVADQIATALTDTLTAADVPHRVQRAGNLFSVFFGLEAEAVGIHNYASARRQDTQAYRAFFHSMLDAGVMLPPSAFEAWFVSAAHDEAAVDRIVAALPAAAQAAAAGQRSRTAAT